MKTSNLVFVALSLITCIFCLACATNMGSSLGLNQTANAVCNATAPDPKWSNSTPKKRYADDSKYSGYSQSELYQLKQSTENKITELENIYKIAEMSSSDNQSDIKKDLEKQRKILNEINSELSKK